VWEVTGAGASIIGMSRFHHMRCLICNEPIEAGSYGRFWTSSFDDSSTQVLPALVIHESCAHKAAHPSFDWSAVEQARAELRTFFDQIRPVS